MNPVSHDQQPVEHWRAGVRSRMHLQAILAAGTFESRFKGADAPVRRRERPAGSS